MQGCSLGYLLTWWYGIELWQFYVYDAISCARVLKWVLIGQFTIAMLSSSHDQHII